MSDFSPDPYDDNNIFAKILRGEMPAVKVYEDDKSFVFMDIMPRGKGHCLVIPKHPCRNVLDAPIEVLTDVMTTVQTISHGLIKAFDADGITTNQYNEAAGGQMVFHLHVHVIPRFNGVMLGRHTGEMADVAELETQADKIRMALK